MKSFSRPGGNITGFTIYETTVGGKWLQLLREIAPSLTRVAMLFNPEMAKIAGASGSVYLQSIEAAAHAMGMELIVTPVHSPNDIDAAFAAISQEPGAGLIVLPQHFRRCELRTHCVAGGAVSHTGYLSECCIHPSWWTGLLRASTRRTCSGALLSYVDRVLKGDKLAHLPVQAPIKYQLVTALEDR